MRSLGKSLLLATIGLEHIRHSRKDSHIIAVSNVAEEVPPLKKSIPIPFVRLVTADLPYSGKDHKVIKSKKKEDMYRSRHHSRKHL